MNWWTKTKTFLTEVRGEMKKVTFPSRREVVSTTTVVLIASFIFAVYLFLADQVIQLGYSSIVGWFTS
jgi:preprotein translocase subunit SecE